MPNFLTKLFAGGVKEVVDSVGGVLDNMITNKEELAAAKLQLEKEINRHFETIQADATKQYELELKDRDSARQMQIAALGQQDTFSKRYMYYLASFVVIAATLFGVMLYFVDIPEGNKRMVEMFADVFIFAGAITVINFFFGSSKSSHDKSDTIAAVTPKDVNK